MHGINTTLTLSVLLFPQIIGFTERILPDSHPIFPGMAQATSDKFHENKSVQAQELFACSFIMKNT